METIKKIHFITLLLFIFTFILNSPCIYGQDSKDEREAERQRIKASNITSVTVTKYEYKFGKREEEGTKTKYLEYDDSGNKTLEIRYKYGEDEYRKVEYKYNKPAGEVEITTLDYDDVIKKITREKYNKNGDIREESEYGSSGDLKYKIIYEFDADNKLVKQTRYNTTGNILKFTDYTYNGSNLSEKITKSDSVNVLEKYTYKYDGDNNLTEEKIYKHEGNVNETYVYKYEGKNRTEEIKQNAEGVMVYKIVNKYNESGYKTERTLYTSDGSTISLKVNYKYDKNGNPIEELESDKIGEKKRVTVYEF